MSCLRRHLLCIAAVLSISVLGMAQPAHGRAALFSAEHTQVDGRPIYTEIHRAGADRPVVILLNGLIYDISRWNPVAEQLAQTDLTVIKMSFSAQPESLALSGDERAPTPEFLEHGLSVNDLASEVDAVLHHFQITKPVTVVGLSYGAAAATQFALTHPKQVDHLLLLSPLVVPLDTYDPSGQHLRQWLSGVRLWESATCALYGWLNPWLCQSEDYWYDSFYNSIYENYLFVRVQRTPDGINPLTYKKAVFHLVRAVRDFDLKTLAPKLNNVHMVIAEGDDEPLKKDQMTTWKRIKKSARRSLAHFNGVVHAVPDEAPTTTADWIGRVAASDAELTNGAEFKVNAAH